MSFPKYPRYKASGVQWLGDVPENWDVRRLKHFCHVFPSNVDKKSREGETPILLCNYTDVYYHETITRGIEFMPATATMDQILKFTLRAGDTIITKDSETADDIAIAAYVPIDLPGVICGYHLAMLRPSNGVCGAFVKRLFDSIYLKSRLTTLANGLTRFGLGQYELDNVALPFPPRDEQTLIVAFLDRETSKIDALIAEQLRLIELLKEKRQVGISYAVTRGLDPQAPTKPSGIEWLGEVPEHWEVVAVRRIVDRIEQGWSPECFSRPAEPNEWGVMKAGCVNRGIFDAQQNKALPETLEPILEYEVHPGDVLMSRASGSPQLVGSTAYVTDVRKRLMISDKIFRIHMEPHFDRKFFVAMFNSRFMRSQIERAISGAEGLANNLPQSAVKAFVCAVPPIAEQRFIALHLEKESACLEILISEASRAVALLGERRSALISAAVTGKIDVRGLVASEAA